MYKKTALLKISLFLSIVGILFYLINLYTPWISDDYLYSFFLTPKAAKSFFEGTFIGFEQKILSTSDIIHSQYNHYFFVNGRTIPHIIEQGFAGILGKEWFNWINVLFFLLLTALIIRLSNKKNIFSFPYWTIGISSVWFLLPHPADILLPMVCAINYVWSALLCLFFLFVYCKVKHAQNIHWPATIFLFLFSIITSWTHEALVIGISGALFLNYCLHYKKQKTKKAEISMMVGFWIGTLLVCLSPAARDRALLDHVSIWETCLALASQLKAFYILFFLLGGMLLYEKKYNTHIFRKFIYDNQFYFYIIFINCAFSLFIGYRNARQLFGIELFSIILFIKSISSFVTSSSSWFKKVSNIIAALTIIHMAYVVPKSKQTYIQYQNLIKTYIQSDSGEVNYERKTFSWWLDPYVWRFGEYLDWETSCISVYYTGNKKQMKIIQTNKIDLE